MNGGAARVSGCVATASLFAGRPDPEWMIDDAQLDTLLGIWRGLAASAAGPPAPPPLGYRGCALRCANGDEWHAYGGVATQGRGNRPPEHRTDVGRRFERALLATAPAGALPDGLLRP
jgi:hypothetical protein